MDENCLSEISGEGISLTNSLLRNTVGALIASYSLYKNTLTTWFEKTKLAKISQVISSLERGTLRC